MLSIFLDLSVCIYTPCSLELHFFQCFSNVWNKNWLINVMQHLAVISEIS